MEIINNENTSSLLERLLVKELRASLKKELELVAAEQVEKILDRAASDFEVSVRHYRDHFNMGTFVEYALDLRRVPLDPGPGFKK